MGRFAMTSAGNEELREEVLATLEAQGEVIVSGNTRRYTDRKRTADKIEALITASNQQLLRELEGQSSLTLSSLGWVSKKLEEHMANIDRNGMKSLVLMQLIKDGTATQEQRNEWDSIVTERRATAIINGLMKQVKREQSILQDKLKGYGEGA